MREIRPSGSAGGAGQLNAPFLPRSPQKMAAPQSYYPPVTSTAPGGVAEVFIGPSPSAAWLAGTEPRIMIVEGIENFALPGAIRLRSLGLRTIWSKRRGRHGRRLVVEPKRSDQPRHLCFRDT